MKETDRQRIERSLEEFATWRSSGLTLAAYAQQRGEDLALWRGRLSWERRWQQMLAGTYNKPATPTQTAFVKAVSQPSGMATPPDSSQRPSQRIPLRTDHPTIQDCAHQHICIVLKAPAGSGLQANIHWPIDQIGNSSAWLREVLA